MRTESAAPRLSAPLWVVAMALVGAVSSTLFSSILNFPRDGFVGLHAVAVSGFIVVLVRIEGIAPRVQFRRRWVGGLIVGALTGALLARTVLSQPASARPGGVNLAWALVWDGGLYGIVDALLLSVLPVLIVYGSRPASELGNPARRWGWGLSALLTSLFITAAYHVGFTEFRGPLLVSALVGNGIMTLSYLASGSPIAPILAHVVMHIATVLHGMATTVQLPPH